MTIEFCVPGEPVGKGRPRFSRDGHAYTPKKTSQYEDLVRACYMKRKCEAVSGKESAFWEKGAPVRMTVNSYYTIPKSASKKAREGMIAGEILPSKKPDCDNVLKAIADALNGIAYEDDAQIVECEVTKRYSDSPRVEVTIEDADSPNR